jgi:cell division protein FtsZ
METKIKVVGVGGSGSNALARMKKYQIQGVKLIAINTDVQDLRKKSADQKIQIGYSLTQGTGSGMRPSVGKMAAEKSSSIIRETLRGSDMVFITCGLGGGCLGGNSLISMGNHKLKKIDSLTIGEEVYSLSINGMSRKKVLETVKVGKKLTQELKTRTRSINASTDHPFLKLNPQKEREGFLSLAWTELESLQKGDMVVVQKEEIRGEISNLNSVLSEQALFDSLKSNLIFKGEEKEEFQKYFTFDKIESIDEAKQEEVYDLAVEGSHNFIANGFLVHNTGSGAAPVVARIAKEEGALTIGVVTLPFSFEGAQRKRIATHALERIKSKVDTLLVIPNDRLLKIMDKKASVHEAFLACDQILKNAIQGISDLIVSSGAVNIDFASLRAVMENAGQALFGMGMATGKKRIERAIAEAIRSPLLDFSFSGAGGALMNVASGGDLSLGELKMASQLISTHLRQEAELVFGTSIDRSLKSGQIRITVIATKVPQKILS